MRGAAWLAALGALAGPARADGASWAPCLVARPNVEAYVAAFEAEGWKVLTGPARDRAVAGPAEVIYFYSTLSYPDTMPAALADQLAIAHGEGPMVFDGASVLARGGAVMAVAMTPPRRGGPGLNCILAAPVLPEVEAALAAGAPASPAVTLAALPAEAPVGATGLQLEALRHAPPEPQALAGADGVILQMTIKDGP